MKVDACMPEQSNGNSDGKYQMNIQIMSQIEVAEPAV